MCTLVNDTQKREYDTRKLRGRIVEKFGTMTAFSKALGIAVQTVSAKLSGDMGITKEDVYTWSEVLDIDHNEVWAYFFTLKV